MEKMEIPQKLVRLTEMTMKGSKAAVLMEGEVSEDFEINLGVRQGDGLSTTLFNLTLDAIIRDCKLNGTVITKSQQIVAYADDLAVIARSRKSLEDVVQKIEKEAGKRGLIINQEKTKYMEISRDRTQNEHKKVNIGSFQFEAVENFKYLGVMINNKNQRKQEIDQRIQAGHRAYYKYKTIMKDKSISRDTKRRVYKAAIRPVVIYGMEAMTLTNAEQEKLRIFERGIIRRIYGGKKIAEGIFRRLMNSEIRTILRGEEIVRIIKVQRMRWYGHLKRMGNDKQVKKVTMWRPNTARPKGRPKSRWEDQVIKDILSLKIRKWREKIQDRNTWRKITEEAKTSNKLD